jgi:hypothetical protein
MKHTKVDELSNSAIGLTVEVTPDDASLGMFVSATSLGGVDWSVEFVGAGVGTSLSQISKSHLDSVRVRFQDIMFSKYCTIN